MRRLLTLDQSDKDRLHELWDFQSLQGDDRCVNPMKDERINIQLIVAHQEHKKVYQAFRPDVQLSVLTKNDLKFRQLKRWSTTNISMIGISVKCTIGSVYIFYSPAENELVKALCSADIDCFFRFSPLPS